LIQAEEAAEVVATVAEAEEAVAADVMVAEAAVVEVLEVPR
jgi:hypothetical protein